MKDRIDIVRAHRLLASQGVASALATVVCVEGSSYRRAGARLLVAGDGRTWGGISGGCLERDVASKARGVIATGRGIVHRYDTTDDENLAASAPPDPSPAASTGCFGAVEIFIQPLTLEKPGPIPFIAAALERRESTRLVSVIHCKDPALDGTTWTIDSKAATSSTPLPARLADALAALPAETPATKSHHAGSAVRHRVGEFDLFVESIDPPQNLVIFGGGPDAVPLLMAAKAVGWRVVAIATRPAADAAERFAAADELLVTGSDDPAAGLSLDADTAVVMMTHNFDRDLRILAAMDRPVRYLGILGPRRRTERLLAAAKLPSGFDRTKLSAPIGLDLRAESPDEIALAVVAEILATVRGGTAQPLSLRDGPIHQRVANSGASPAIAPTSSSRGPGVPSCPL
jgi:xanthine/CO dehydrogenase XdhC/CoxF family maturation factor